MKSKCTLLTDYQDFVLETDKTIYADVEIRTYHYLAGLTSETGEVAQLYQKHLRRLGGLDLTASAFLSSADVDADRVLDELGDVLWYTSAMANLHGSSLRELIHLNIDKLNKRNGRR